MTNRISITALALAFVLLASTMGVAQSARPTFTKDVLPILQENCITCHRQGGDNIAGMVAPMSLVTYQEVRPWAKSIVKNVVSKNMPPWFATEDFHGVFSNERRISEEEIQTIVKWVESGAARGNPKDAPAPIEFPSDSGWLAGEPDLVVSYPEPYFVADDVEDLYTSFISDPISREDLPNDRWLRSIEWRGGSEVVHHIVGSAVVKDEEGVEQRFELGSIAPGEEATNYPEGYGKVMHPDSRIRFSMHYHKEAGAGTGVWDQSTVGFRFWDEEKDAPVRHAVFRNGVSANAFEIPPGHPYWEVGSAKTFDVETQLMSLHPHMHLRGKDCKYVMVYPDGTRETILDVPAFDFNWQLDYTFAEPKIVPAGSRLEFTAHYDNSPENIYNPDPTIPMGWGGPTTMEMMIGYVSYTPTEPNVPLSGESGSTD